MRIRVVAARALVLAAAIAAIGSGAAALAAPGNGELQPSQVNGTPLPARGGELQLSLPDDGTPIPAHHGDAVSS